MTISLASQAGSRICTSGFLAQRSHSSLLLESLAPHTTHRYSRPRPPQSGQLSVTGILPEPWQTPHLAEPLSISSFISVSVDSPREMDSVFPLPSQLGQGFSPTTR